jgi:hypothetical protein
MKFSTDGSPPLRNGGERERFGGWVTVTLTI